MSLRKRVRIGKYAVPVLLLLTIAVGTVAAVAYVVLTMTFTLPIAEHPRVYFWNEGTTTEANTMGITMNIFPDITTIDEDAPWDIRASGAGDVYIRVSTMDAEVASVKIKAFNTTTLFEVTWNSATTDWGTGYNTSALDYDLWIEVVGASGITTGEASVTVDIKVEEP